MTLKDTKPGDVLAVFGLGSDYEIYKLKVTRVTKTRVFAKLGDNYEVSYSRNGRRYGAYSPSGHASPWDSKKHPRLQAEKLKALAYTRDRSFLDNFHYSRLTESQAAEVMALLTKFGYPRDLHELEKRK